MSLFGRLRGGTTGYRKRKPPFNSVPHDQYHRGARSMCYKAGHFYLLVTRFRRGTATSPRF